MAFTTPTPWPGYTALSPTLNVINVLPENKEKASTEEMYITI
jgi:hypothetical protein